MHKFLILGILLAVLVSSLHCMFGYSQIDLSGHAWGSDDAYISYRYAENLIGGAGLVFNPHDRVEGYTNFLYVLVCALIMLVLPNHVFILSFAVNTGCYVAAACVLYAFLRKETDSVSARLGTLAFCLCPILWVWPGSGLETSAVMLVQVSIFVTVYSLVDTRSRKRFLLLIGLTVISVLLRADGFIFPLICMAALFLKRRYRYAFQGTFILLAVVGVYIICRYLYYGDVLPNTYYAKVSGPLFSRVYTSIHQFIALVRYQGLYLYLAPMFVAGVIWLCRMIESRKLAIDGIPLLPFIAGGLVVYWLYVGGDVFHERFLITLIPLGIATVLTMDIPRFSQKAKSGVVLAIVLLQFTPYITDRRFEYRVDKYDRWMELGKHLAREHPAGVLAIDAAGKVPFYTKLYTIDMYGMNDRYIAHRPTSFFSVGHNKSDMDYVLSRDPTLIAAWGRNHLGLALGVDKDTYESRGYRLKYVVNSLPEGKDRNIIDVRDMPEDRIVALVNQGYDYFVLAKAED